MPKKNGDLTHAVCPICAADLLCKKKKITEKFSIKLLIDLRDGRYNHHIYLSSIWGNFHQMEDPMPAGHKIQNGEIADFHCPYCMSELKIESQCPKCGTPMFSLLETDGKCLVGRIKICCKSGCHYHEWEKLTADYKFVKHSFQLVKSKKIQQFLPKPNQIFSLIF